MRKSYYVHNRKYAEFLDKGNPSTFSVYLNAILDHMRSREIFLDIGCGTGIVVDYLTERGIKAHGVEISKTSLDLAKKRQGHFKQYDGLKLPYPDNYFLVVGSIDVVEHVEDVNLFLKEALRVTKTGGYLVIFAPNFLSLTNSYHHRTSGAIRKIANIYGTLKRVVSYFTQGPVTFEKFPPVFRDKFHPDDDATNLINPLDLLKWAKLNHLRVVNFAGSFMPPGYLSNLMGRIPLLNLITGGVALTLQK